MFKRTEKIINIFVCILFFLLNSSPALSSKQDFSMPPNIEINSFLRSSRNFSNDLGSESPHEVSAFFSYSLNRSLSSHFMNSIRELERGNFPNSSLAS